VVEGSDHLPSISIVVMPFGFLRFRIILHLVDGRAKSNGPSTTAAKT
jgi:hypothetical protein